MLWLTAALDWIEQGTEGRYVLKTRLQSHQVHPTRSHGFRNAVAVNQNGGTRHGSSPAGSRGGDPVGFGSEAPTS